MVPILSPKFMDTYFPFVNLRNGLFINSPEIPSTGFQPKIEPLINKKMTTGKSKAEKILNVFPKEVL